MGDIKELCNVLWNYKYKQNNPIVIVAPDCTQRYKLRVYANGGRLGKISIGEGETELLDTEYDKYLSQKGVLKKLVEDAIEKHTQNDTFIAQEYLENGIEAIEARFHMKEKKDGEDGVKERYVETAIVRKYMRNYVKWSVIDMEAQFPSTWFPNANFSEGTTKSPRFDLVVINEDGIGIVELKVNNENCCNMQSHYEHMTYVMRHPEKFQQEFQRRIEVLEKYELISREAVALYKELLNKGEIPLWCGFLFVGGEKEDTLVQVQKLGLNENINDLKFMYYDSFDVEGLDINKMVSYEKFVR